MSIQHREDSIRDMKLERLGVTPPQDWNDVEQVRTAKKAEIGLACSAAIYAGIDVGGAHYSHAVPPQKGAPCPVCHIP